MVMSADVATLTGAITLGSDGIRGSHDDFHHGSMGGGDVADSLTWYRKADNNPVVVDSTEIDIDTYSRSVTASGSLPPGHTWGSTANHVVANALGLSGTQAVMYSGLAPEMRLTGLSADDVNMVKMGMTGNDRLANTSDDYTVTLSLVTDCQQSHDIEVLRAPTSNEDSVGECPSVVGYSFPQSPPSLAVHFSVMALGSDIQLTLNESLSFDFGPDLDDDGVPDSVEDGAPNGGDGNSDGMLDSVQANVTSLPNVMDGQYVTLASPEGTMLVDVQSIEPATLPPLPVAVNLPIGVLEFKVDLRVARLTSTCLCRPGPRCSATTSSAASQGCPPTIGTSSSMTARPVPSSVRT